MRRSKNFNAGLRHDEFIAALNKWQNACNQKQKYSDDFKIGYIKSLAGTMYARLPKHEREFILALLNGSSVYEN